MSFLYCHSVGREGFMASIRKRHINLQHHLQRQSARDRPSRLFIHYVYVYIS